MTVCSYFLQGRCRYGDKCWNEHPRGGRSQSTRGGSVNRVWVNPSQRSGGPVVQPSSFSHGGGDWSRGSSGTERDDRSSNFSFNTQNRFSTLDNTQSGYGRTGGRGGGGGGGGGDEADKQLEVIQKDMEAWESSGQWLFSCYSALKDSITGFVELSPEELRMEYYTSRATGDIQSYVNSVQQLANQWRSRVLELRTMNANTRTAMIAELSNPSAQASSGGGDFGSLASSGFGSSSTSGFGSSSTSGFGSSSTGFGASTTGFGSSSASTTSGFGSSSASGFGSSSASGFGSSSASGFGSSSASGFGSSSASGFGSSSTGFGSSSSASGFGSSSTSGPRVGGFGSSAPGGAAGFSFSASSPGFGSSAPQPAPSQFGLSAPSASSFSFSDPAASKSSASGFNFSSASTAASGAGGFGSGASTSKSAEDKNSGPDGLYTSQSELTPDELREFTAKRFTLGQIPLRPPPAELLHV
ncbi:nucleoporin NUP42 isoform 3-T3 [Clarias gariepinus]|uniref:nucleoporin NUP42 isoform X1 n=1 Tax=Clarias gariepinus TaxID=13013 RepID=UPI00234CC2F5|nr:nucleoporin NUP42 isoform X1 [Clarias gariepinus]